MGRKRDTATAQAQIDLQYGPQFRQVRDLWNQTHTQYLNDLSAARQQSRAGVQAANAAQPVVKGIYDDAAKSQGRTNSFIDKALAASTAPSTPSALSGLLTTAMERERGSAANANTAAKAGALTGLVQRASGAQAGKQLAYNTAKQNLLSTRKQLTQRLEDLTGESKSQMTVLTNQLTDKREANSAATKAARAKVDAADQKRQDAADAAKAKHIDKVHTATGAYANKISDAQADWRRIAKQQSETPKQEPVVENGKVKIDPKTHQPVMQAVLDPKGNPVYATPTPSQIKEIMLGIRDSAGHAKYTPGDVHIALLVGNKPLDAEALAYLKRMRANGVRIPRSWVRNATDQAISNNQVAGPPKPLPR